MKINYLITCYKGHRQVMKGVFFCLIMIIGCLQVEGQQLEIDWDGSEQELIRFIEDNLARFAVEGFSDGGPDRITFKIRTKPGDTLTDALTLYENGIVRIHHVVDTLSHAQDSTAGNVVVLPDGTLALRKYEIGDTTRGGIVFWVDETGEHGLVCAFADQSDNAAWGTLGNATGAIRDNTYGGMTNTERIIINQGTNVFAADLCAQYDGAGYGDWYLPSKEELNLMWKNLHRFGCPNVAPDNSDCPTALGGFAAVFYWSSTEFDGSGAWGQYFFNGLQTTSLGKNFLERVRAIRAF